MSNTQTLRRIRRAAAIVIAACSFGSLQGFEIREPEAKALFEAPFAAVIVDTQGEPSARYDVIVDGEVRERIVTEANRTIYCSSVSLEKGGNRIEVAAYPVEGDPVRKGVDVYLVSPVDKQFKYPPEGYQKRPLHTEAKEALCSTCHDMSVNEKADSAFEDVTESNCYDCHKALTGRAHNHAPAVNWLCTSCHDGQTGPRNDASQGSAKYLVRDPVDTLCFACHKKSEENWNHKSYHHEPAEAGRCNRCHDPHGSDDARYLRKAPWELCTGCHADKTSGMHVVNTSFVRSLHPVRGKPDPSRPGRELSCISCHNPHASNKRFFLPDNRGNQMICTMCHKK